MFNNSNSTTSNSNNAIPNTTGTGGNVQRAFVSGPVAAKLGGAQSAFHAVNSPPSSVQGCRLPSPSRVTPTGGGYPEIINVSGGSNKALPPQDPLMLTIRMPKISAALSSTSSGGGSVPVSPNVLLTPNSNNPGSATTMGSMGSSSPPSTPGLFLPTGLTQQQQSGCHSKSSNESSSSTAGLCHICSDRATGKHYGAHSCDGCKGFFRRTIRKNQVYTCRFSRSCLIDKDKRNTCRHCRFDKCVKAGMRKEAVQNERDRISVKRIKTETRSDQTANKHQDFASDSPLTPSTTTIQQVLAAAVNEAPTSPSPPLQLQLLQHAENLYAQTRTSVITPNSSMGAPSTPPTSSTTGSNGGSTTTTAAGAVLGLQDPTGGAGPRLATVADLADAIKEQLLLLVEWAKALPPFVDLSLDDQVSLLRAYAAEHLLLGVARRSLPYEDVLLLSNDACIPRHHSSQIHDVNHVVFRILDELVEPMRELQLDDTENGCLKALLFFNPSALGLTNKQKVKETRQSFLEAFHEYVTTKRSLNDKVRFGNLLLLLPPLQAMSQQFVEDLQLATLFGISTFDKLLEELLLATGEQHVHVHVRGVVGQCTTSVATAAASSVIECPCWIKKKGYHLRF